jgi:hypothetical protein
MDDGKITDLIIKITFGKLEPMQPPVKEVVDKLVSTAFILGMTWMFLVMSIMFTLYYFFG